MTMIHLQCTQAVLKYLSIKPQDIRQADETTASLGNWSVSNFVIDDRHAFLFVSDKSLLSFILLEGKMRCELSTLQGLLQGGLRQLFLFMKVPTEKIDAVLTEMDVVCLTKTKDRALVGQVSSILDEYQHRIHFSGGLGACDLTQIILGVNNAPRKRLGWSSSIEITQQLLANPTQATH